MNVVRVLLRRAALGVVAAWTVLTTVFLLFTATDDWVLARRVGILRWGGADEGTVQQMTQEYLAGRGYDRPLWVQYVDWLENMVTLRWGTSFRLGEPVLPLLVDAVVRTAAYVLPALVLAVALGVGLGLYVARNPESRVAGASLGSVYLVFAVPNVWIGGLLVSLANGGVLPHSTLVFGYVLPCLLAATTLLGGVTAYARAYAAELTSAEFVRLVTATGAPPRRVAAHILRNAAVPVLSTVVAEALALLVLAVFVIEVLLGIDGFGRLLYRSVDARDLPVLLGGTLIVVTVGVLANVVQDLAYGVLDPRIDAADR
ncbi:ABC transporter permease [Haloarcula litorea]|uniref:ABC transporter permease n=1 Tax=Haloarcula litorea TaxID=3032579 RepID=UPI0023E79F60|nr:ABC transporter permease [Halomicroarcula sp. GDY20]